MASNLRQTEPQLHTHNYIYTHKQTQMEIEIHLAGDAQVAPIKMINIDRIVRRFKVSLQEW